MIYDDSKGTVCTPDAIKIQFGQDRSKFKSPTYYASQYISHLDSLDFTPLKISQYLEHLIPPSFEVAHFCMFLYMPLTLVPKNVAIADICRESLYNHHMFYNTV